ncbi:MAG: GHKL domain-containing protein [Firmicutes bacterium]|uniref:GHKL domain-containing protein n=1 Tax=Candidatus Gallilactobacillus intestinavium TaxID=2840838 RepID=A0A9D9H9P7_9LACO|nr:GHKL domain-containing protein [Candidatus Gallilactobacillus intestinavium]
MIYALSIAFIFINSFILQIAIKKSNDFPYKYLLLNSMISILCMIIFPIPLSVGTLLDSIAFPVTLYALNKISKLKTLTLSGLLFFSLSITFVESFFLKLLLAYKFSVNNSILLSYLIIILINIFLIPIIKWFNSKIKIYDKIIFIISIVFFFVYPLIIILLEMYDFIEKNIYKDKIFIFDVIFMLILFLFLCIALFLICKLFLQKVQNDYQIKMQQELIKYTTLLEKNYEKLRFFKHDYANILLTLEVFIRENDMENLKKYYFSLAKNFNNFTKSIPKQINNLHFIKDKPLKSIIFDKLNNANSKNIVTSLVAKEDIEIDSHLLNLCRIVGILLDNAIESSSSCTENKFISIDFIKEDESLSILIKNSYKGNLNTNNLYKNGYTTKGKGHGQGLKEVRYIVNQHKNWDFNIYVDKKQVVVKLSLKE